jgi:hypothetical protein
LTRGLREDNLSVLNSADARSRLASALGLDLVGPGSGQPSAHEALPQAPSRWYLTGFLVPYEAVADDKEDKTSREEIDVGAPSGDDDEQAPERASARRAFLPSSIGISVLVPSSAQELKVVVSWGDYRFVEAEKPPAGGPEEADAKDRRSHWQREPLSVSLPVPVGKPSKHPQSFDVPGAEGLRVLVSVRNVAAAGLPLDAVRLVPPGTRAVSVFLVNHRTPSKEGRRDEAFVFQPEISLGCPGGFVARPNLRGHGEGDWDDRVADLQFRDAYEFAVGHGISTRAAVASDGACDSVGTAWLPTAEVQRVEPAHMSGVELSMEGLAACDSAAAVRDVVGGLTSQYRDWITRQRASAPPDGPRGEVARQLLDEAAAAAERIDAGLQSLGDPDVLEAFRMANRAMAAAARQRTGHIAGVPPDKVDPPRWRPFQLAFVLMNLRAIADPRHPERERVDLLFFPTGGGKTEAYLGLAAFTLVLRRLRNPGRTSVGVSVLMRYTLRLLTLDQLSRAATLICALELERLKAPERLGDWPFEIGLWVGKAATPNAMGQQGDGRQDTARARTVAYQSNDSKPVPIPIENCPWCGEKFRPASFNLVPNQQRPVDLRIVCLNRRCQFTRDRALPIVAVDEPIYRRLPCFLIATVDKYASLPWVGRVGALFGRVERHDPAGFYGPCDPGVGTPLTSAPLPPDLIIQDELHLISGPLGSMAGLYETAIEALCTRMVDGEPLKPKIVASTATVRRADRQVRALFARPQVVVFPPPGPDRRDSFFALTVPSTEKNARLYVGIAAQGRSPKLVLLRTYLALLASAQRLYVEAGGKRSKENPADPYMTLVGYFNALRELGGSRRIVEDEVGLRLHSYGSRLRVGETEGAFANRKIGYEPVELTSRESTSRVAEAKRRLALPFHDEDGVDVALATNMISVGLDITRLGLMVVLGQPKTTAEYIQATSRVGREESKPGLVVTLFNVHRARDRSHYERFEAYHESFYRAVEVTSVTPFSPRAIDRGLPGVVVGLARHGDKALTPPRAAIAVESERERLSFVAEALARRAESHAALSKAEAEALRQKLKQRVGDLLDAWTKVANEKRQVAATLQYQKYEETGPYLLFDPLDPEYLRLAPHARKFKAYRSLRDVEASTPLWVKRLDGMDVPAEEEA